MTAARLGGEHAEHAIAQLCAVYWYPIYAFVRRSGHSPHDAEDLTQSFFARLLEKKSLGAIQRDKGKFRSFLLASLKNFLANEWDKANAAKRGGRETVVSLDEEPAEDRYLREQSHMLTPEKLFEQSWVLTVIDAALCELRQEYVAAGKEELFDALQDRLIGAENSESYADLAVQLKTGEGALRMTVLRMRRRVGDLLRAQVQRTVETATEVEEELRELIKSIC